MSRRNDGGPAFPNVPESFVYVPGQGRATIPGTEGGMTLRDYFIAHAPAEPQPWFEPVVETQQPMQWLDEQGHPTDVRPKNVVEGFLVREERKATNPAFSAWLREYERCRYIQWPAAWADAMLAERERGQ